MAKSKLIQTNRDARFVHLDACHYNSYLDDNTSTSRFVWISSRDFSVPPHLYYHSTGYSGRGIIRGRGLFIETANAKSWFFITFLFANLATLVIWKLIVRQSLWYFRKQGYNYRGVLIIGSGEGTKSVKSKLESNKEWGLRVVGMMHLADDGENFEGSLEGQPYRGDFGSMQDILSRHVVDEILITSLNNKNELIGKIVHVAEEIGVRVRVILDLFQSNVFKSTAIDKLGENYALTLHTTHLDTQMAVVKRTMDVFLSVFGIMITAIVSIPIAALIKCTSQGPIIFKQRRMGQNGRLFNLYKFRSMYMYSEKRKQELLGQNEMNNVMFKMENDPRITPCGKFLRKYSLDELPPGLRVPRKSN